MVSNMSAWKSGAGSVNPESLRKNRSGKVDAENFSPDKFSEKK
jgi:hypothetical protein